MFKDIHRRNTIPIIITLIAIILLILLPNKFPQKIYENTERVSARVISTDENFIVNNGYASARDILDLILLVEKTVFDRFRVELKKEVILVNWE